MIKNAIKFSRAPPKGAPEMKKDDSIRDQKPFIWENQYKSTSSQGIVLAPLMSASEVFVRIRARNGKRIGDWSEHASIIVK